MSAADKFVRESLIDAINQLLEECTEKQQGLFHRIYPHGLDGLTEDKLKAAYALCERTLTAERGGTK